MFVKYILLVALVPLMLFAYGCAEPAENGETEETVIEPLKPEEELPAEIEGWIEENKYGFGGHTHVYDDQLYILATYGERPTGGYSVEITEIVEKEDQLEVSVHYTAPEEGEPVTQAITYPYDLVIVEETELPVDFVTTGDDDVEGLLGSTTFQQMLFNRLITNS